MSIKDDEELVDSQHDGFIYSIFQPIRSLPIIYWPLNH